MKYNQLKKLKVVELASVLAGPSVGLFFAELGAKVVKVENKKTGGDVTRSWKLPTENKNDKASAYYYSVNLFKKILFADLSEKKDNEKVQRLIADADILIVNFKKGDEKKFNLGWNELRKKNPHLIYAAITGFGEDSDRIAYDLILQAESGFMSMNGTAKSGPVKMPVALIDLLAAHQLKEGILLALLNRTQTKKGAKVSVSLYDAAVSSLANQASNFLNAGFVPGLAGTLHPNIAPYGEVFESSDKKKIVLAIGSDEQFRKLCSLLKIEKVAVDPRFHTNQARVTNRKQLRKILLVPLKKLTAGNFISSATKNGVPAAAIRNLSEVLSEKRAQQLIVNANSLSGVKSSIKTFIASVDINN
jgi:crotonobetainyl-CoA:carnitine CoA-transferase CaiB-like acyl-CoA transferase